MITQESIEEVKDRASLIEIIGESGSLKRQGTGFIGLCPFHSEKTPSFHIRDNGKFYHCFGCGASGNAISYYMQTRGVPFPQAVEELAERFGITLKFTKTREDNKPQVNKGIFFDINSAAVDFFLKSLKTAPDVVKNYIKERGLKSETIEAFQIGFSPVSWSAVTEHLRKLKVKDEDIVTGGLARRNVKGELYDIFRGRLIFPIFSDNRKAAAFGGRLIPGLLDAESTAQSPKYLNSPDNPVYQKNKILFGLPQAFSAIRENSFVYIVEGYMDVISLWQAGVKNVIATCGTALSAGHVKRLSYLCKRVFILFDGDNAGRTAAAKAFSIFMNSGIEASILFLPEKDDPDSIATKFKDKTSDYLQNLERHSLLSCHIDAIFSRYSVKSVKELGAALKGQVAEEVSNLLKGIKNAVEREELINEASFKLMLDKQLLEKVSNIKNVQSEEVEMVSDEKPSDIKFIPVSSLPSLDQEILRIVMAKKNEVISKALNEADLCAGLQPCTLAFMQSLSSVLLEGDSDDKEKKEDIKNLLKEYGDTWVKIWKDAHEMIKDIRVDFMRSYSQCLQQAEKNKLIQLLTRTEEDISNTSDQDLKARMTQECVNLSKRIRQINLPQG